MDAEKYDTAPEEFPDRNESKGITIVELSSLWTLMRGVPWDEGALEEFPCIFDRDDYERTIHRFPIAMVESLVSLSAEQISSVAELVQRCRSLVHLA